MTQVAGTIQRTGQLTGDDAARGNANTAGAAARTSMRSAAIAGSVWVIAGYGASQVLRLGGNLVLAWLVAPSAFGLMLIVNTVLHGLAMFSDIGIGPSIIQNKRGDEPKFLRTAWTIQIIRGFILWAVCCALAWPVASMLAMNDPTYAQLVYLLPVAGLAAVIAGFNSPAIFTLNRRLAIGRLTRLELSSHVFGVGVMIAWGIIHPTVWALLAGGLATVVAKMVLSHVAIAEHRMALQWHRDSARALFNFGKWIFASTIVTFLALHLDKAVLGALMSAEMLGLYAIALVFAKVTMHVAQRLSATVVFPILSRYQDEPARVVSVCLRSRSAVLWLSGAACACFAIAAPLFFESLYDPRYHAAGEIARWLSMYIWAVVLVASMDQIPLALGAPRALFIANLIKAVAIGPATIAFVLAGLPGFIAGLTLGWLAAHAYLIGVTPCRRSAMVRQSFLFTTGWAGCAILAILLVDRVAAMGALQEIAATAVVAGATLLVAVIALWRSVGRSVIESFEHRSRKSEVRGQQSVVGGQTTAELRDVPPASDH